MVFEFEELCCSHDPLRATLQLADDSRMANKHYYGLISVMHSSLSQVHLLINTAGFIEHLKIWLFILCCKKIVPIWISNYSLLLLPYSLLALNVELFLIY